MNVIRTQIDAELETFEPPRRSRSAQARFDRHRSEVLDDRSSTALAKLRVSYRGVGLTMAELSARTGDRVSVSTIQRAERGVAIGDDSWAFLALALIDPTSRTINFRSQIGVFRSINPQALFV